MRARILLAAAVCGIVLCGFAYAGQSAETNRFNVLFIISDDLRCELGSYGSKPVKTPNIDRLAAAGVRFDRAYCQFPLCNPSRASMLNGRYPLTTGVLGNRQDFRTRHPDFVTLPQLFKQHGYATLRAGKIFHGGIDDLPSWTEGGDPERLPGVSSLGAPDDGVLFVQNRAQSESAGEARRQNSDRWIVLEGDGESHGDYRTADRAIEFLKRHRDKPFFLGCGFVKPHSPPTAPRKFYDLYDLEDIPLPPDFAERPTVPEGFPRLAIRPRNADLFIGRDASPQEAREMIRAYIASVSWMDWNVGRVIAALDELGLREKTIIVFWGDHGYQLGEKGKWSKAGSLFEQGTRSPLIIVAPGVAGNGRSTERIVQAIDIYPTLAELCGLPLPDGIEGRSLVPLLNDPGAPWDRPAFTIWSEDGKTVHGAAVRVPRWRYAEFHDGSAMLFDEENDPHELRNLADDPKWADVRKELSATLRKHLATRAN
ncbi:MAG TPA: sulfatase [Verrucomicrobia bacterium]|nr:sulfatase [Verrucomicrobiota bacterium]HOB31342.1 sulfatase [Verrucomicrobiota bacterium]HOP97412.1 sulfatase [Verrucomicrobiota bacterium]